MSGTSSPVRTDFSIGGANNLCAYPSGKERTLPSASVTLLDVPAMAISSSAVRERVRADRPVWYLVPDGVVQYIGKHRLYLVTA